MDVARDRATRWVAPTAATVVNVPVGPARCRWRRFVWHDSGDPDEFDAMRSRGLHDSGRPGGSALRQRRPCRTSRWTRWVSPTAAAGTLRRFASAILADHFHYHCTMGTSRVQGRPTGSPGPIGSPGRASDREERLCSGTILKGPSVARSDCRDTIIVRRVSISLPSVLDKENACLARW